MKDLPESIKEMQNKPNPLGMIIICTLAALIIYAAILGGIFKVLN